MSDDVNVPEIVMAQALKLAARGAVDPTAYAAFPVALVDGLIEFFRESGGCDHEVGICCCEEMGVAFELELARDNKQVCSDCGGEGAAWDEEKYQQEREKAAAEGLFVDDFDGLINCPQCQGSGTVPVTGMISGPKSLEQA